MYMCALIMNFILLEINPHSPTRGTKSLILIVTSHRNHLPSRLL